MNCRQRLTLTKEAGIGHQLPGAAAVVLMMLEMIQQVHHTEADQGNRMEDGAAQRWKHSQGKAQGDQKDKRHQNLL